MKLKQITKQSRNNEEMNERFVDILILNFYVTISILTYYEMNE